MDVLVRNGKIAKRGVRKGFARGSKTFDNLGRRLSRRRRSRKSRISVERRRFKLEGQVNPWVLLASEDITHIDDADATGKKAGDDVLVGGQRGRILSHADAQRLFESRGRNLVDNPVVRVRGQGRHLKENAVYKTSEFGYMGETDDLGRLANMRSNSLGLKTG